MALEIGIVGLPNVGKSTLFNALTRTQQAQSANYPFCTIEPNKAVVPVPDARIDTLAELVHPQQVLHSTVEFVDIAGLVKGASQGEGLGNTFLASIRECDAILHVVRCFRDDDVLHVEGSVDPLRDIETIEMELLLADAQTLAKRIERLSRQVKGDKKLTPVLNTAQQLHAHLEQMEPVRSFAAFETDAVRELLKELPLISARKSIYCCNVDEQGLTADNDLVCAVREHARKTDVTVLKVSARLEEELAELDEKESAELLASYGVTENGLTAIIRSGFHILGLISYFTAGEKEVRAWTLRQGSTAPEAAGVIHTDFERGFIRAEVISYADYIRHGSEAACRNAGVLRTEGKSYQVADGDVMHFLFNV